ncbi:hypothetical protein ACSX1A_14995 [Pontibacter sp. MBLB2868]|uniref:hypothetical protein n=1 Tax=Pontibacter sp. MBLB2868 TaxID=3451555 RepID=UPI003F74BF1C
MKKIIAILSLGVLMAGTTYAQTTPQKERKHRTERKQKQKRSPEEMAAKRTEMLTKKLDLNKSQQKKLLALNLKHAQEKQAMMQANRGEVRNHENMRSERQANRARYEAELKDILNKKQYAQYEADKAEMHARHEKKREQRKEQKGELQHRS